MRYPQYRCCWCQRFVPWDADESISFGSTEDTEPPDPEHYCAPCAKKLEDDAVAKGYLYQNWVPAEWERRAAKRMKMVRAGPKGAAWGHWYAPDKVPDGYVWHEL